MITESKQDVRTLSAVTVPHADCSEHKLKVAADLLIILYALMYTRKSIMDTRYRRDLR